MNPIKAYKDVMRILMTPNNGVDNEAIVRELAITHPTIFLKLYESSGGSIAVAPIPRWITEVVGLLARGMKLEAIKRYRNEAGTVHSFYVGLKEAKDICELLQAVVTGNYFSHERSHAASLETAFMHATDLVPAIKHHDADALVVKSLIRTAFYYNTNRPTEG